MYYNKYWLKTLKKNQYSNNEIAVVVNCNNIMAMPIIRLLGKAEVNVVGVFGSAKSNSHYHNIIKESKYLKQRVFFDETHYELELINVLKNFGESCKNKPVLFLASDTDLNFISLNRDVLKDYFLFTLPEHQLIKKILNKELFIDLAHEKNLPIPFSKKISSVKELYEYSNSMRYPIIIKPSWRNNDWLKKYHEKKLFIVNKKEEIKNIIEILEDFPTNYLIQEIIPGPEENIFCSFAILDNNSEPIEIGFCRKLRQYPPDFGNTSVAQPIENEDLKILSLEIFQKLNLKGYASIEFKLDPRDHKLKIMETTPNRFNRQFAVTWLNGINLPLQLFNFEMKIPTKKAFAHFSRKYWLSEVNEIRRIRVTKHKIKGIFRLIFTILNTRVFEIFDINDIKPFFALIKDYLHYFGKL